MRKCFEHVQIVHVAWSDGSSLRVLVLGPANQRVLSEMVAAGTSGTTKHLERTRISRLHSFDSDRTRGKVNLYLGTCQCQGFEVVQYGGRSCRLSAIRIASPFVFNKLHCRRKRLKTLSWREHALSRSAPEFRICTAHSGSGPASSPPPRSLTREFYLHKNKKIKAALLRFRISRSARTHTSQTGFSLFCPRTSRLSASESREVCYSARSALPFAELVRICVTFGSSVTVSLILRPSCQFLAKPSWTHMLRATAISPPFSFLLSHFHLFLRSPASSSRKAHLAILIQTAILATLVLPLHTNADPSSTLSQIVPTRP